MKKIIRNVIVLGIVVLVAFWAKGYYNDRYVIADSFYTQIPLNEVNEDSWLLDSNGNPVEEGKRYSLMGYNQSGMPREVSFTKRGKAEDYYAPGTYIRVDVSKTLEIGLDIVQKQDVPEKALEYLIDTPHS